MKRTRPARPLTAEEKAARAEHAASRTPVAERLQKRLANAGVGSRREVEAWIRAGRLTVNGQPAVLGQKVLPSDQIRLDDRPVRQRAAADAAQTLFVAHRSPGEDLREELIPRLPRRAGRRFMAISPMPHQDGGIELLTADGALAAQLQRAVSALASEYRVRVKGELIETQRAGVLDGHLDDGSALNVESLEDGGGEGANRWLCVTARGASGKEIRQLMERNGALVSRVLRTRLGTLALTRDLLRGQFREVTAPELQQLRIAAGLLPPDAAASEPAAPTRAADSRDAGRREVGERPVRPARRTNVPSHRGPPDRAGRGRGR